jgi:hypothetical protein
MPTALREQRRKRLLNVRRYWTQKGGATQMLAALNKQLAQLPIGGIAPEITEPLVAHCGTWWRLRTLPFVCPRCSATFLIGDTP